MAAGIGSITSTPNIAGNRQFRSYLNQSMATSGRTPSAATLDQIIQGELDAQARRVAEQQRFGLEERRLAESGRQFDIGQQTARDIAKRGQTAGLVQAGAGLGTTAMMFNALRGKPLLGDYLSGLIGGGGKTLAAEGIGKVGMQAGRGLFTGGGVPTFTEAAGLTQSAVPAAGGTFSLPAIDSATGLIGPTAAVPLNIGGQTALSTLTAPAVSTGMATLAPSAPLSFGAEVAGLTQAEIDAAIAADMSMSGVGTGGGAGFGFGSVALPLAAYGGMRFLGDNVIGGTIGDILKRPLTGVGSYGLSKLGDITGVKELGHAGKFLGDVEETLIQKPIDAVTGAIGSAVEAGKNFVSSAWESVFG